MVDFESLEAEIYYKQAVFLILLYESFQKYPDDYIVKLCELAIGNAAKINDDEDIKDR